MSNFKCASIVSREPAHQGKRRQSGYDCRGASWCWKAGIELAAPLANQIQLKAKVYVRPFLDTVQHHPGVLASWRQLKNTVIFNLKNVQNLNNTFSKLYVIILRYY